MPRIQLSSSSPASSSFSSVGSLSMEEISAWFKFQDASNRLESLTALLQMLHPLELRFIATYVEDLARKDVYVFREPEKRYNNGSENGNWAQQDFVDFSNPTCRSKLLVALSLLYSGNYVNACVLYKTLFSLYSILNSLPTTKELLDEVLLILTMAKHHPAFRYDQRAMIAQLVAYISRFVKEQFAGDGGVSSSSGCSSYVQVSEHQIVSSEETSQATDGSLSDSPQLEPRNYEANPKALLLIDCATQTDDLPIFLTPEPTPTPGLAEEASGGEELKVDIGDHPPIYSNWNLECVQESLPLLQVEPIVCDVSMLGLQNHGMRNFIYQMKVLWSNGEETLIEKTYKDWHTIHESVLRHYPYESAALDSKRSLPYYPGFLGGIRGESDNTALTSMDTYLRGIKSLPQVFHSNFFADFLKQSTPLVVLPWLESPSRPQFTDFNDLSPISMVTSHDFTPQPSPNADDKESASEAHSIQIRLDAGDVETEQSTSHGVQIAEGEKRASSGEQEVTHDESSMSPAIASTSHDTGQRFLPTSPIRCDGFHQGLTTTLLILRPTNTSISSPSNELCRIANVQTPKITTPIESGTMKRSI